MKNRSLIIYVYLIVVFPFVIYGQSEYRQQITAHLKQTLLRHKEFVSIPNLPADAALMLANINWVADQYKQ